MPIRIGMRAAKELAVLEQRSPLLASAARVNLRNPGWKEVSRIDEAWQRDAWYFYRLIPAFHYGANWAADACGRADIYVADVDERGVVGGPTKDPEVSAIADTLFGGPAGKQRMMASIAVSLIVAGECYVIGRGGRNGSGHDEWQTVAPYEIRPYSGGIWIGQGAHVEKIPDGSAAVFRVWKSLAESPWLADSPGLALLQTLRELEQINKFKAAQTDSRLANAGIYPIPTGLDFTHDDSTPPGAPSLQAALIEAANASLEGKGSAAQISPIFFEVDPEILQHMFKEPIKFGSIMSDQIRNLEEIALQQLAIGMSLPPEVVLGTGTSNQWSAWEIGESAVKYHIEPLLNQILEAMNVSYLAPAIKKLKKDPARYTLQADTSALTVRPNRFADALNAFERFALSGEALRRYGDFKEVDAPSEEETTHRRVQDYLNRDPQLMMDPEIVKSSGLNIKTSIPVESTTPPPPPPERVAVEGRQPMPARPSEQVVEKPGIIAAQIRAELKTALTPSPLLAASSAAVHSALTVAGKRMTNPSTKKQVEGIEPHLVHTVIRVEDDAGAQRLTAGAFGGVEEAVEGTGVDPRQLRALLSAYTHTLLKRSIAHDRTLLAAYMADYGLKPWQN